MSQFVDVSTVCRCALDTRRILTWKPESRGRPIVRACLAVQGFQDPDLAMREVLITVSADREEMNLLTASTSALKDWALL